MPPFAKPILSPEPPSTGLTCACGTGAGRTGLSKDRKEELRKARGDLSIYGGISHGRKR